MKKIIRIFILLLVISSLAGITSSCAIFSNSHAANQASFQHKKPLPKRYIINNGDKPIAK